MIPSVGSGRTREHKTYHYSLFCDVNKRRSSCPGLNVKLMVGKVVGAKHVTFRSIQPPATSYYLYFYFYLPLDSLTNDHPAIAVIELTGDKSPIIRMSPGFVDPSRFGVHLPHSGE